VTTVVGPPLGIGPTAYASSRIIMPPGSTLLAFTDGLVERRGEAIQIGFDRLAEAAVADPDRTLDDRLTRLLVFVACGRGPGRSSPNPRRAPRPVRYSDDSDRAAVDAHPPRAVNGGSRASGVRCPAATHPGVARPVPAA